MENLLIITQKVDEQDDVLGFFVDWIREFAKHYSKVSVITLATGYFNLPKNVKVYSLGKEKRRPKIFWPFIFYWRLAQLIPGSDAIFAHMSPVFTIATWPLVFIFRKKVILWYLHRSVTFRLRMAIRLAHKVVTADRDSLGIRDQKIIQVGHGIDTGKFDCIRNWEEPVSKILSVGRISPIKSYETLISAVSQLDSKILKVSIIGRPFYEFDDVYFSNLKKMVKELKVQEQINFLGLVPHSELPPYYSQNQICVGLTPRGGIDKFILEAMAAGCLTLTSNTVMAKYLGEYASLLVFNHGDVNSLKEKLKNILSLTASEKEIISGYLKNSVQQYHSLANCVKKISILFH